MTLRLEAVAVACLILFAAPAFTLPAAAQAETAFPDLTFLTEEWKPYHYLEDGVVKGQTIDLLVGILRKVGSTQGRDDVVVLPWARAYRQAQQEPNTVLFSTSRTPEREKLFKWAGPILKFESYFIGKKEKNFNIQKSEDLHQYKVGVVIDSASAIFAKRHGIPEANTTFNSEGILNIRMLDAGRIDFIPIQWANFERLATRAGVDPSDYEPVFLADTVQLNFAFNLDTPDWVVERFQAAFEELLASKAEADSSDKTGSEVN
ncbi:substrate-binding periplasmic protein [Roseibium sediminicola]|uniref:ABC transporter substrate-binding protein n=1 Tax=Roseibium sediminicola TaxID=2933272 RepID=A0ABT0GXI1_9HYPH|nr:ABC transporter substrate-binding protein [Roseibium sp. CAU 1639]MCK7614144.1 ABC transporter substrate-binding protein [Roseibium sp. CAU 1639]